MTFFTAYRSIRLPYMSKILFVVAFLLFALQLNAQKIVLEGLVLSDSLQKPVAGARIQLKGKVWTKRILTDRNGQFRMELEKGLYEIQVQHISFGIMIRNWEALRNEKISFYLKSASQQLNEVTVQGNKKGQMQTGLNNYHLLKADDVAKVPGFLGEGDLIKTLQTLPGIGKGGEGNAGLFVRGGNAGQNLVLFNHSIIYNPSHLLGFFSVFNTDAVEQTRFYKSGIPSEYGGRLSSVVDVRSSEQIADSTIIEGDLSILAAKVNLKVPLGEKWSFASSIRKTFMNQTVWPLVNRMMRKDETSNSVNYDFYDLNFSAAFQPNKKDRFFASVYLGGDDFKMSVQQFNIHNGMDWKNRAASLSWKRSFSERSLWENTFSYSNYRFNFYLQQEGFKAGINSAVRDFSYSSVVQNSIGRHHIKGGLNLLRHYFKPNTPFSGNTYTDFDYGLQNTYNIGENSVFASDEFRLSERMTIYAGLRFTYYQHKGPYSSTEPDGSLNTYAKGKTVSDNFFLEPSLTMKYYLNKETALKLTWSDNVQTVHLIPITSASFPSDIWMPSISGVPPESGQQISLGIFKDWAEAGYEGYVDVYARRMKNVIEFSGGMTTLLDNLKIEDHVLLGKGRSYGAEFYLKKNKGPLTGYLSYTLSKSDRIFTALNEGNAFPFKYDRTHDFTLVSAYELSKRWTISALFTFATGNAYTMPVSRYLIAGNVINEYGKYNGSRMPDYHRLDLSAGYQFHTAGKYKSILSFSVYNVYNRKNPIYNYYLARGSLNSGKVAIQEKSVALLPVLPAINYKIFFK